ncbi:MAG: UDP-N-acetylmuramoyl-L-alanyl-D-glutamate--2,6-diaminopimelate ligase [Gammaproteobacteria bacterium]|nr:UDP-N-acetylmuramoyl-L-alanyl-D-glutamate--2,6-diaminopimelate ligase [Gammaproteobacteria bacterium]
MMPAHAAHAEVTLGALFGETAAGYAECLIGDITMHSAEVTPGALFMALAGRRHHGLDFVDEALRRGARAVAWEPAEGRASPQLPQGCVGVRVPRLRARLGAIADEFFAWPSAAMSLAAVTGTNGKTTVAWLVASALEQTGQPCAYIGTLGHGRTTALADSSLTTPDVITLHRWLAAARDEGCRHGVLEASSHALDQARLDAVRLRVAAFTNLSHDHLDYHGSMQAYAAAKARLFAWPGLETAVINADDACGAQLLASLPAESQAVTVTMNGVAAGGAARRLAGRIVASQGHGLSVAWSLDGSSGVLESALLGRFNAANLLLALGMLVALDVPVDEAAARLSRVRPPPGRMQLFGGAGRRPLVVVDFAHTPDALERVLQTLREHRPAGRLLCVFGCGGDRDRGKRALMGEVAGRLSDHVILTDDNPRSEDGEQIIREIRSGLGAASCEVIRDRAEAIRVAVTTATSDDLVLVAGKGHEQQQRFGSFSLPFSDEAAVRAALELQP